MSLWEVYSAWNQAVADVFFTEEAGGQPVYLDLDDDAISLLGERVDISEDEVWGALASAVRGVIHLDRGYHTAFSEPMTKLARWLRIWRGTARTERLELDPPPVLGLLAVFSMAAERMGRDISMAPNNYFGRLCQILDVVDPERKRRLEQHYRRHVEFFWHVLSLWLTGLDGMRGLPSAVALSHRYIGLSVSQALVREHDRTKLPRFFATYGLSPGQEVTPGEVQTLLDEWLRKEPPPISRSLATLWQRQPAARERIAGVVASELQAWNGVVPGEVSFATTGSEQYGDARLVTMTRSGLFGSSIEFNIVARMPGADGPRRVTVASAIGDEKPVLDFVPGPGGWHRLQRPAGLESASLLDGILTLVPERGVTARRRPRRVVPMRKDESLGLFLEVERLQLAEDALVLAAHGIADEVERALKEVARPGFRRVDGGLAGLPQGWVLFLDVQVLGLLADETRSNLRADLNVLLPSVASQLTLAGGLKLPGQMRKYSSLAPPEIRAVAVAAEQVRIKVVRKRTDELGLFDDLTSVAVEDAVCERSTHGSAMVLPLASEHRIDGDYEALLYVNDSADPAQRLPFWLRSGDSVDLSMWKRSPRLVYNIAKRGGWAALSADIWNDGPAPVVDGALANGSGTNVAQIMAPRSTWWTQEHPPGYAAMPPAVLTTPDPTSCLVTGAHHWDLPYATTSTVHGICRNCGLVKRFPNSPSAAKAGRRLQAKTSYHVDVRVVEPVQPESLTWDIAFDALMHAGGGGFASLERIALQVEGSSLFVDTFIRTLEALGHLEVRRDEYTVQPVEWEVSPSTLAETSDGSFLLVGYWPAEMRERLAEMAQNRGGHLVTQRTPAAPSRRVLLGLTTADVESVAESLDEVAVAEDAARSILRVTPNLSAVEATLPQVTMPGARRIRRFDVASASWVTEPHAHQPGAYRLESFGITDVVRRADDIAQGTARIGTVHLVKHLEALRAGRPLLAYDAERRRLQVPIGADLPGLYGRTAVLCSGHPPEKASRLLIYRDVPSDVADMLATRLAS